MINFNTFYNDFIESFYNKNLAISLNKMLKLLNINHKTFYNNFYSKEEFINSAFNYILKVYFKKRSKITNDKNIYFLIKNADYYILNKIKVRDKKIEYEKFLNNIEYYKEFLKFKYYDMVLYNLVNDYVYCDGIKIDLQMLIDNSFEDLLLRIKNRDFKTLKL